MAEMKTDIDKYVEEIEMKLDEIQKQIDELIKIKKQLKSEIPEGYYQKKYYDKNREKILDQKKTYYQKQLDMNQEYRCDGCDFITYTKTSFNRHLKTKKHMKNYPDE